MRSWFDWPMRMIGFLLWYAKEFILANLRVTADILRPHARMRMAPAIVAVPAASRTASEYTMISSLITLTPGTLTITLSREHGILYVHGMFVETRDALAAEIQEMEDRMLRAMRREPGDLSRPSARPTVRPTARPADDGAQPAGSAGSARPDASDAPGVESGGEA